MNKEKILIAEDEDGIREFVCRGLADSGYETTEASDGLEAWQQLANGHFSLVILDIRMPGLDGLEVCRKLRQQQGYQTPVLMLTALNTTDDIVMGLRAGADDYLAKPFKFMELIARIEALLRRVEAMKNSSTIAYADLHIDPVAHRATRGETVIDLSTKEFRLLEYFIAHHDEPLSRRQLLKEVWDKDFDTNTNIVYVYVKYLRTKIDDPAEKKLIHTITGVGYIMKAED